MTTAICNPVLLRPVADISPLWDALNGLGWSKIPSDLTEIDAAWCSLRLLELDTDGELSDLLQLATWEDLNGFAWDLRDAWHTARCEAREFDREVSDHRDYV